MDKINWSNFNYDDFERFCNALLTFELGKSYTPFSAPGTDGGIDGAFEGTYANQKGKWRFQFKFSLTSRKDAVANLKFQAKKEAEKLASEDHFILITNVEFLPQEQSEIKLAFEQNRPANNQYCSFAIWDGAKINALYSAYPILSFWLNEGFDTAELRDYKTEFKKQLETDDFVPGSLGNFFIGRENALEQLRTFLTSQQQMVIVSGDAGIGKTRLAIEFFRSHVESLDTWSAMVLTAKNFSYDKISRALYPGRNYVVLVDDAHSFSPAAIADLKSLSNNLKNVKLILTTRSIKVPSTTSLINIQDQQDILRITLDELSRPETRLIFTHYYGHTTYKHFLDALEEISFGKPILIVAMLRAMAENIQIADIRKQDFLKSYVRDYFGPYIEKVKHETNISILKINELLQAVVLIEPFDFNSKEVITALSEVLNLEQNTICHALELLKTYSYVNGRYEQSIKPDYYSDILLSDIDSTMVIKLMTNLVSYAPNMIVNLASVGEIKKDGGDTLNQILRIYVDQILTTDSVLRIKFVMRTIQLIAPLKQDMAKKAIENYIKALDNDQHILHEEISENRRYNYFAGESSIAQVIHVLKALLDTPANTSFAVRSAYRLYELTDETGLTNIFSFEKRDVIKRFAMDLQTFFVKDFNSRLLSLNDQQRKFALLCMKNFLNLEFIVTESSPSNRMQLTMTTYYIPVWPSVQAFRKLLIDAMASFFRSEQNLQLREDILGVLLDVPRSIFASRKTNSPYESEEEISTVLNLLKSNGQSLTLSEQKEVLEKLYWFERWGMPQSLTPLVNEIKEVLKPKDLVEELSYLFSNVEMRLEEIANPEEHVSERTREIVKREQVETLAEAVLSFLETQQHPPHFFWRFLLIVAAEFHEHAKIIYEKLEGDFRQLFIPILSSILHSSYYQHHDEEFYWQQVNRLQLQDNSDADNIILGVYAIRVPQNTKVTKQDTDTIIAILGKKRPENDYQASMAIQLLFAASHPQALALCIDFLDRVAPVHSNIFFIRLTDNETVTDQQLATIVLEHSIRFQLRYEIEKCLAMILKTSGVQPIFDYLIKRFERKIHLMIEQRSQERYEFVPHGDRNHLFSLFSEENPPERLQLYQKALEWYCDQKLNSGYLFFAKDLLDYLQPAQFLNKDLFELYSSTLAANKGNAESLIRTLDALSTLHDKDDRMIELIVDHYDTIDDFQFKDEKIYTRLRDAAYSALTTMGVKTGTAGQPFAVDLDLKALLQKHISGLNDTQPVKQFLNDVLKSVNSEIDRGIDRENSTW